MHPSERIPVSALRKGLAQVVRRVHFQGLRFELTLHGRSVAGLVPFDELQLLESSEKISEEEYARRIQRQHERWLLLKRGQITPEDYSRG